MSQWRLGAGEHRKTGAAVALFGELAVPVAGGVLDWAGKNEWAQVLLNPKKAWRRGCSWLRSPWKGSRQGRQSKLRWGGGFTGHPSGKRGNQSEWGSFSPTRPNWCAGHGVAHRRGPSAAEATQWPGGGAAPRGDSLCKWGGGDLGMPAVSLQSTRARLTSGGVNGGTGGAEQSERGEWVRQRLHARWSVEREQVGGAPSSLNEVVCVGEHSPAKWRAVAPGTRCDIHSRAQVGEGNADERAPASFRISPDYSNWLKCPKLKIETGTFFFYKNFVKFKSDV
jgi:hypothetical protein